MKRFYKIEDDSLRRGSGKIVPEGFTEFTTSFDEEGNEVFPAEMQSYLEAEAKEQEVATKIAEAKQYLTSTDFYFTVDKYATLTEERKLELNTLRAEARVVINDLEG